MTRDPGTTNLDSGLGASTTANAKRSRPILHTFTGGLAPESRTHDEDCQGCELESLRGRVAVLEAALRSYEQAVQTALRIAPNHWQQYRDPFELGPGMQEARRVARALAVGDALPSPGAVLAGGDVVGEKP